MNDNSDRSIFESLPLQRLWFPGDSDKDFNGLSGFSVDELKRFSEVKTIDHWDDKMFLFLIGQAGSGKSTYLKRTFSDQKDSLYIDLKTEQSDFLSALQESEKWRFFVEDRSDGDDPFFLIIDGWDELTEERSNRKSLISLIKELPTEIRERLRLRISTRPELPEKAILTDLQKECPWLIVSPQQTDEYRIILAPLCNEQIRQCFTHFSGLDDIEPFYQWCHKNNLHSLTGHIQTLIFLITAYSNNIKIDGLTDLWEKILEQKVKGNPERNKDKTRVPDPFPMEYRLNALGDIAIHYLLTGRNSIPHPDSSNNLFILPAFQHSMINGEKINFLLSSPIFTPGGVENIHFAQAREAEFLAARRLATLDFDFYNLKRLIIVKGLIPDTLKGLSKWLAVFIPEWLEFLSDNLPDYAVDALNLHHSVETRNSIISKWWFNKPHDYADWYLINHINLMLPETKPQWIYDEIESCLASDSRLELEILIRLMDESNIPPSTLGAMQTFLSTIDQDSDLYTDIIKVLGKNNFGDLSFWRAESRQDIKYKGGRRIPTIATQLQRYERPISEILDCFVPVTDSQYSLEYSDFLFDFFSNLSVKDIGDAITWRTQQSKTTNSEYNWLNRASDGLLSFLIRNKSLPELYSLAEYSWQNHSSFFDLFTSDVDEESHADRLNDIGFTEYIFSDPTRIKQFQKMIYRDYWIANKYGILNILEKYKESLISDISSEEHDLYLSILLRHFPDKTLSSYIPDLMLCKEKLEGKKLYSESLLYNYLEAWNLLEEKSRNARESFLGFKKSEEEHKEFLNQRETDKRKKTEILEKEVEKISSYSWEKIYNILRYGNEIESRTLSIKESILHSEFWTEHLKKSTLNHIIREAEKYLLESQWQDKWTEDFRQDVGSGKSFTVNNKTLSPILALRILWYELGESDFKSRLYKINHKLWLKFFWGLRSFYLENLSDAQWAFLLQDLSLEDLKEVWTEIESILGSGARIPSCFAKSENSSCIQFVETVFNEPFVQDRFPDLFREYSINKGHDFLNKWFISWLDSSNGEKYEEDVNLLFLLRKSVQPAWEWLLNHDDTELIERTVKEIHLDHFGNYYISDWPLHLLIDVTIVIYNHWPPSSDINHEGVYTPNWRDNISQFRSRLLDVILNHEDFSLETSYKRLKDEIQDFDSYENIRISAEQKLANESIKWSIKDIAKLLSDDKSVIIKDDHQLTSWLLFLIEQFDKKAIDGEYPLKSILWDEYECPDSKSNKRTSKHEDAFSNLLLHWLRWRTDYIDVLGVRENPIVIKSSKNPNPSKGYKGKRVDIDIQYPVNPKLRSVIEVKKSNNPEWRSKGLIQLRDYLKQLNRKSGIYLVFKVDKPKTSKHAMMKALEDNLKPIKDEGYEIIPYIIEV